MFPTNCATATNFSVNSSGDPWAPVNGEYGEWGGFSGCITNCSEVLSFLARIRLCDSPVPLKVGLHRTVLGGGGRGGRVLQCTTVGSTYWCLVQYGTRSKLCPLCHNHKTLAKPKSYLVFISKRWKSANRICYHLPDSGTCNCFNFVQN